MAARVFGGRMPQYFIMAGRNPYGMGFPSGFAGYPGYNRGGYSGYYPGGYSGYYPSYYPSYFPGYGGGYQGGFPGYFPGGYPRPAPSLAPPTLLAPPGFSAPPVPYLVYRWPAWFSPGYPAQGPGAGGYVPGYAPGYPPRGYPYSLDAATVVPPVSVVPPVLPVWYHPNAAAPPAMSPAGAPWSGNPYPVLMASRVNGAQWNEGLDESMKWDSR